MATIRKPRALGRKAPVTKRIPKGMNPNQMAPPPQPGMAGPPVAPGGAVQPPMKKGGKVKKAKKPIMKSGGKTKKKC
jgi:hypothetical protein